MYSRYSLCILQTQDKVVSRCWFMHHNGMCSVTNHLALVLKVELILLFTVQCAYTNRNLVSGIINVYGLPSGQSVHKP